MTNPAAIAAYVDLSQAKARYCRAVDTKDWNTVADLMTSDIEFGIGDTTEEPQMVTGRHETLALLQSLVADSKTAHQVYAPEIDLDGDTATVIWAVQDRAIFESGLSVTGYGHYYERWVTGGGRWRVASMKLIHLFVDVQQDV
ncbi:nuclear transport factor 2 family protein [Mycobacteroides abscessus]|uniref:nuclear transport factor 2 family protein n=1 Tax=Mycobacteroides abscessus TaxID=36809 RepID=UPI0009261CC4|nr:nuclear transport factor 2 family protein [Mycobacteroides abscessus]MDO3333924.1 nuclear transport factor 2 family protein [Mycobacteroides abscessus subsp. bolletii]QSM86865.1 nuclear transport factor 2 family protein [Mycobacteroides abscessus subsp. bolletii]SIB90075.1 SnoaL-like polyketide cyclase [Mycobacteroides abscessus subsp. bolletii]SKS87577.1 SnoaL-like polyketide cyclase [Mycobacteroides abscessus subsp. bolletii]SKT10893.1 SnoaL-like polyketide cyclase [Mycobacteroides absces